MGLVEDLLRIGEFSRASFLSVKALRAYHESGLLVPAEVDRLTGYRSYTAAQLTDATIIRRLRELDVPLEQVRIVLDARDPEVTRKVLAEHGAILEERVAAMQQALAVLQAAVDLPSMATPVHVRHEPAQLVLEADDTIGDFESLLAQGRALLEGTAMDAGAVVDGTFGGVFGTFLDDDQPVTWFLPIAEPPPFLGTATGVRVGELPATDVAVLVHRGPLDGLDEPYRLLGTWVAANAASADLPVRERYVDDGLTEICWPILPKES